MPKTRFKNGVEATFEKKYAEWTGHAPVRNYLNSLENPDALRKTLYWFFINGVDFGTGFSPKKDTFKFNDPERPTVAKAKPKPKGRKATAISPATRTDDDSFSTGLILGASLNNTESSYKSPPSYESSSSSYDSNTSVSSDWSSSDGAGSSWDSGSSSSSDSSSSFDSGSFSSGDGF